MDYAQVVEPHCGKTATGNSRAGEYIHRADQVAGEIRLVRYWHGLGQEVSLKIFYLAVLTECLN